MNTWPLELSLESKQMLLLYHRGPNRASRRFGVSGRVRWQDSQRSADKAGMPHQHVPVAGNAEATGGLSEATKPILARLGRVSLLTFFARAKKVRRPPVREPAIPNYETNNN